MAEEADIGRDDVIRLLNAFYARVRRDDLLRPLFESEISDWDGYIVGMADFWCDALVNGAGPPPPSPPGILYGLTRQTLARWFALFGEAQAETLKPAQAERIQRLSRRINELHGL